MVPRGWLGFGPTSPMGPSLWPDPQGISTKGDIDTYIHTYARLKAMSQLDNNCWLSLPVKERARRMDRYNLGINEGPVSLLGVLLGSIAKETGADGLLDTGCALATRDHIQLVSVHDSWN